MLRDFVAFVDAIWDEWKTLLTGGSLWGILVLWQKTTGIAVPPDLDGLIVGMTLIAPAFLSWRKQWINSGKGIVEVNLQNLTERYTGRTYVHARAMVRPYIGKRVRVTGKLRNFYGHLLVVSRATILVADVTIVVLRMSAWKGRLFTPLPIGTEITVSGRIAEVNRQDVHLDSVEVLDFNAETTPDNSR